jgi:type IV pilus assembly protein PilQ
LFRGRGLNLGVEFTGSEKISTPILSAAINPTDSRLAVDVNAAIKMFESDQLGEVIARPQVTVRSGATARFQSGQDFSIKQRDFSNNIIDQFYSTGTILTVTPKYYESDGTEFVVLNYQIERSSATPGEVTTLVDKVGTGGSITLLDGEETYVGGLYSTSEVTVREGIPLLKDLPWWVFGLRYLFGFDSKNVQKKELIVLMKAELIPLLQDRQVRANDNKLQNVRKDMQQDLQRRTGKKN